MILYAVIAGAIAGVMWALWKYMPAYRFGVMLIIMALIGSGIADEICTRYPTDRVYFAAGPMMLIAGIWSFFQNKRERPLAFNGAWGAVAGLIILGIIGSVRLYQFKVGILN